MTTLKPTKGKLLIAEPSILMDSSFNRSVVLLTEHNDNGSVGFIFNKPSPYNISDLIPDIDSSLKVYFGGPVSEDNLYFVHKVPDSGWSQKQLEEELQTTSWLIVENEFKNLFKINPINFWKNELLKYGGIYQLWANAPKDPGLN